MTATIAVTFAAIAAILSVICVIRGRRLADLRAENARLSERIAIHEREEPNRRAADEDRFRRLAGEILSLSAESQQHSQERRLNEIIAPLKADIERFSRNVTQCYDTEARERFSLKERIRELVELNNSIGREAHELSTALRGNTRVQGNWGELVLETILQKSGLRRGHEYVVQETSAPSGSGALRNDEGTRLRPDVVVYYPDGRCVVIDSKVSLTAYMNYVRATTPEEERQAARQHLASVRNHIAELRGRNYQDFTGTNRTDFVMMFIPNEPAYLTAMQLDGNLWQEAYDSRVLLVSPTHLISALRLVDQLWRRDRQTRNAMEIATAAGRMYDKFVSFTEDMARIDSAISSARDAWSAAMNKLTDGKGNLISRAQKLRELGAKTSKSLPDNDTSD